MIWQPTPYTIPLTGAGFISLLVAIYIWQRRPASGAGPMAFVMSGVTIWIFAYALQLASASLDHNLFWGRIKYMGILMIPTGWLIVALQYTGQGARLSRRFLSLLTIHPFTMTLLIWSNEYHHLIWINSVGDTTEGFTFWQHLHGPAFWVHTYYAYLLVLTGSVILIRSLIRSPSLYQGQMWALLIAALAPILGNIIYLAGWTPFPKFDMTPFAFVVTGLSMIWGIFRFQLFDIVPAARSMVIESMNDGMLVLDQQNRIVDINPAALTLLDNFAGPIIGQSAARAFEGRSDLIEQYRNTMRIRAEIEWTHQNTLRTFDMQISPLCNNQGRYTGRVVTLRDITERKQAQLALRQAHDELEQRVRERTADLQRTNACLQIEIAERRHAEEQLRAALQEKEVMLKEIHHRVKNNLQIISSLLHLQTTNINHPLVQAVLSDTRDRVRSMALIHEKLYQSPDLARINFAEYIRSLVHHLFQSYTLNAGRTQLELDLDNAYLSIDTAIHCGLIINELVTNALKYAFPAERKGLLEIHFHPTAVGGFILRVADDGIGMPPDLDFRNTPSLGLQLVTSLVAQMDGTIDLDRNAGTTFEITFPN